MYRYLYLLLLLPLAACEPQPPMDTPTTSTLFRASGLDVAWNPVNGDCIAYSGKGSDGFYDIHLSTENGSTDNCITCNHPDLPNKHIACPYWHPSGKWLLFVAEKETHPGSSVDALPGFGAYCDVWLMDSSAEHVYKIIDIPNDYDHGVIAPRFSPDGNKITWTHRVAQPNFLDLDRLFGHWVIKTADFQFSAVDSTPVISNEQTLQPGPASFYEGYGFSPDGQRIIFCSHMNKPSAFDQNIYTMNLGGGNLQTLTDKDYNEHAFYMPDGSKIIWMCNKQATKGGTDWWMMNTDGSEKKRITYYNEPEHPQYAGKAVWCGLGSFHPSGNRFVGGQQLDLVTQEGQIVKVEF